MQPDNIEPIIIAATSAMAAQHAAWQAAVISIVILALNVLTVVVVLYLAYRFNVFEKTIAEKERKEANGKARRAAG